MSARKRILFVDDESFILQGLKRSLRSQRGHWDMVFATSGIAALKELEKARFDAIVTDMRMPGMDGPELLMQVLKQKPQIVRLILSGHADDEMMGRAAGVAHQFLNKPCEIGELTSTLNNTFDLSDRLESPAIVELINGLSHLASPPKVYKRLVDLLESEASTLQQIGDLIGEDVAMSAKLLQMTNSAFFGVQRHVTSAQDAAVILGMSTLKALVLSIGVFSSHGKAWGPAQNARIEHALQVASLARTIAEASGKSARFAEECFLAGMLHDFGLLVLEQQRPEQMKEVQRLVEVEGMAWDAAELQVFGASHDAIGAHVLNLWGLPISVVSAVAGHHLPSLVESTKFTPLTAVHVSDVLVSEYQHLNVEGKSQADERYLSKIQWDAQMEYWSGYLKKEGML